VAGTLVGAAVAGAFFGLGPLYAQRLGLGKPEIATYMSAALLGGALLQWPIGGFSDRVDRRVVIGITSLVAGGAALATVFLAGQGLAALLATAFLYGGTMLVLYALCVAHANDLLPLAQFLDAARGFNFLYGVGAALAPVGIGALMSRYGAGVLYVASGLLLVALGAFALFRALLTPLVIADAREEFVAVVTPCAEALEMYPHTPLPEEPGKP
jgi:MFS family permease